MMAPYGTPYPPFCPPGGVYAHPALQMVTIPSFSTISTHSLKQANV